MTSLQKLTADAENAEFYISIAAAYSASHSLLGNPSGPQASRPPHEESRRDVCAPRLLTACWGIPQDRRRPTRLTKKADETSALPGSSQPVGESPWRLKSRQREARNPPTRVRIQSAKADFTSCVGAVGTASEFPNNLSGSDQPRQSVVTLGRRLSIHTPRGSPMMVAHSSQATAAHNRLNHQPITMK